MPADKVNADNWYRVSTELHVFIAIATSFVLSKTNLTFEVMKEGAYDTILLISFLILVPGAYVAAIISKVRHMNKAVKAFDTETKDPLQQRRRAFDLHVVGLGSNVEKKELQRYIDGWAVHGKHAAFLSHFKVSVIHGLTLYTDLLLCTAARVLTGACRLYRDRRSVYLSVCLSGLLLCCCCLHQRLNQRLRHGS